MIIPVILSGGSGTRLWPLSRQAKPKQFRSLSGPNTLLQDTASRLASLRDVGTPLVICGPGHADKVTEQLTAVDVQPSILIEPSAKNTGPAVAAACLAACANDPDAIVVVLPSDHVIGNVPEFASMVEQAIATARRGYLTTFGVVPTYPATGYGYIHRGETIDNNAHEIVAFVEKPDAVAARRYLAAGYLWNAGIFVFRAADFLSELLEHAPIMHGLVTDAYRGATSQGSTVKLESESWDKIDPLSVDYAVMEPTQRGAVLALSCGWSDVGSWTTVYDLGNKDAEGNVVNGQVFATDTKNSYIHSESKPVVVLGVQNLIIVETEDAVLVMHRDSAEAMKDITTRIPDHLK